MNNATSASLSNVPLLPICCYISAFSTFFISKNLMTINGTNQSVPVINALFEYLHTSKNESLAKNYLLLEVLDKTNSNQENWNRTLNIKDLNETCQHIITASLFHHCRNITGYLSGYKNRKESKTFSEFRNVEALLEKCINNNLCSTINETRKLTSLAIEKLLEHIWPLHNQEEILKEISNSIRKKELTTFKRFKRQPPTYTHNLHATDSELESLIASKMITDPHENFDFTDEQNLQLYSFLLDQRDSANSINKHGKYFNDQSNGGYYLPLTSATNLDRGQQNAVENLPNVSETSEMAKLGNKRPNNIIDNDLDSDNVPSTSKKSRNLQQYANSERERQGSLEIGDGGKSKRMLYIQEAAKLMCSCETRLNFNYTVDMLKGLLLKLEESKTLVPTYNQFAKQFCDNLEMPSGYDEWKIPPTKGTFIDDVLFKSYLDTKDITKFKFRTNFPRNYTFERHEEDVKMYQSSIKLRKSLRLEDFLFMRFHLLYSVTKQFGKKAGAIKQITTTHYNLALRECEEDWINEKITLYAIYFDSKLHDLKNNSSARREYTFKKYVEFSLNILKELSKLENISTNIHIIVLYTLELENQAGIVNIDRLFGDNTSGRYIVPINMSFSIVHAEPKTFNNRNVFSIEMRDERSKEKKMIEMVKYLLK